MEQLLICMSLSLIAGLLASRAAKAIRLPAVTSYLVAGLLLGPFFLGRLGLSGWGFGFGSLAQVEGYGIITQVALGFIAFVIGNEFRLSALESMGRQAVTVGILQAVITTVLVDIALVALHFARPDVISMASAITLGAIASATAPAATLMVVKQYKASGPLTRLLLMVVAIDDAVGLVLFSASFGIANALEQGEILLIGLGGDGAGLQLRLKIAQAHQPGIAVHQKTADEENGGNPHDHIHQIQPQKRGKPHPQHLPEQLPPVLGQVFLFKISLSALSVEIAVHQLPEHTRALQTNSDNERMIESYILHYTILCVKREINGL